MLSKHGRTISPSLLSDKCDMWIKDHRVAYGISLTTLKTHLMGHLSDILRRRGTHGADDGSDQLMVACWALERVHVYAL